MVAETHQIVDTITGRTIYTTTDLREAMALCRAFTGTRIETTPTP